VDIRLGENTFVDVQIPLLWGSRAISQDRNGCLSVVDLSEGAIKVEIIGDKPVPGVPCMATGGGYDVLSDGDPLYHYNPVSKTLTSISLGLPTCQVGPGYVRVGGSLFSGNMMMGTGVGIAVTENGTQIGASLPPVLEALVV